MEREVQALIGVAGALRAQGAEVELPSLSDARDHFDAWLAEDFTGELTDDKVLMRALGLSGGD